MSNLKATEEDVRYAYRLLLGREPDEKGFASHRKLLGETSLSATDLARGFLGSLEFISRFGCLVQVPVGDAPPKIDAVLQCQACTQRQIESPAFLYWARRLGERPGGLHRKLWEWCFAAQALYERGVLQPGAKGLGFAVGTEPLTALFASMGCHILATDLDPEQAFDAGWIDGNQHAAGIGALNSRGICPQGDFDANVRFRNVDMRAIPDELKGFDFLWSSCAMEHLGSLEHGLEFIKNSMKCLRPGGVAVHTTELNCDSNEETIETGGSVIYRQRDLLTLAERMRAEGNRVEPFNFYLGETDADRFVDEPPYKGVAHIKLRIESYASTSFGLIISKSTE
jgi:hypothetical protein